MSVCPPGAFASTARKRATLRPTMSGVMVTGMNPIRSLLPGHSPNRMNRPSDALTAPTLFRNMVAPDAESASMMVCMTCDSLTCPPP